MATTVIQTRTQALRPTMGDWQLSNPTFLQHLRSLHQRQRMRMMWCLNQSLRRLDEVVHPECGADLLLQSARESSTGVSPHGFPPLPPTVESWSVIVDLTWRSTFVPPNSTPHTTYFSVKLVSRTLEVTGFTTKVTWNWHDLSALVPFGFHKPALSRRFIGSLDVEQHSKLSTIVERWTPVPAWRNEFQHLAKHLWDLEDKEGDPISVLQLTDLLKSKAIFLC